MSEQSIYGLELVKKRISRGSGQVQHRFKKGVPYILNNDSTSRYVGLDTPPPKTRTPESSHCCSSPILLAGEVSRDSFAAARFSAAIDGMNCTCPVDEFPQSEYIPSRVVPNARQVINFQRRME